MFGNRKRKIQSSHIPKKKQKISHGHHVLYLSFPFSRAVVKKDKDNKPFKEFELRSKEYKCLHYKRVFVAESEKVTDFFKKIKKKNKDFVGVHPKLNNFFPRPGCVIGALDIGESFQITDSHLTDEFAAKCGLTLDGLKYFKEEKKQLFAWKLMNPKQYKGIKPTKTYIHNHGNPTISRTSVVVKHHPQK